MSNNLPKRVAIIGTAPSYKKAPYDDHSIQLWSLNDAYSLGIPRADQWFDLHPTDKMWFRPKEKKVFRENEIPEGLYIRPEGHLEWLKQQATTIPVWLQNDPPEDWPINAQRFPFERAKAFLKARPDQDAYVASSPALILAHAILEGFTEIHVYGIHLATQGEYIKQRPGFEWLLGKAEAMGIKIILPPECPLLKHTHVYAYEPEPVSPDLPARKRLGQLNAQYQKIVQEILGLPWWRVTQRGAMLAKLQRLRAEIRDAQLQGKHALMSAGAA